MLTPSSNTVLEPLCQAMVSGLPATSVHFSRFRVTEIDLTPAADRQFTLDRMLQAAELLTDANVDAISWNGTSASWLGFDHDRRLCDTITAATGRPASTSVLTMMEGMRALGCRDVALVTPYVAAVQDKIVATLREEGLRVVAERHLGLSENYAFGTISEAVIAGLVRGVAASRPEAVLVLCTNLRAAPLVARLEQELNLPILDSVATAVAGCLSAAGADPSAITGWGRFFGAVSPAGAQAVVPV